jgi:hypothetical protein
MNALLWTLAITGAINTIACLIDRFQTPVTTGVRVVSAIFTLVITLWAVYLLAKGAQ